MIQCTEVVRYIPTCAKCGTEVDAYFDDPTQDICEDCCDDHDYKCDKWERAHICQRCGKHRELDSVYD